jgi:UDP-N-acetylglucosamine 2-epimerase (non-hydrolysing)
MIIVAGARPNFMKIKPLMKRIEESNLRGDSRKPRVDVFLVHTGQHYDENMSDIFFRELGIRKPDDNLEVGSGSHALQTAKIMMGFESICEREKPDWVIVVGDVNSTMACTLVCAKLAVRVAHIEAGLRSFDRTMPEEINRVVTDQLADLLFTPSEDANRNLLREGQAPEKIKLVGNIMIDSLMDNLPQARLSDILSRLDVKPAEYIYVTLHRPANVDDRAQLAMTLGDLSRISRRLPIVFPVHPRTRKMVAEFGIRYDADSRIHLTEPLGYHASLCLAEKARVVLTDSGGLQEETTFFRTPCLTLRPNTERPVTVTIGSNRLTTPAKLLEDLDHALEGPERTGQIPPLWDGQAASRILDDLIAASTP